MQQILENAAGVALGPRSLFGPGRLAEVPGTALTTGFFWLGNISILTIVYVSK